MSPTVVVIGCGAIGACTALELARRGVSVTIVDRGPEPAWGCSAGNAGLITPGHSLPLASPENLRQGLLWLPRRDSPLRLAPRLELVPWLARYVAASTASRAERGGRVLAELAAKSLELHAGLAANGLDTGFRRSGCLYVYESQGAFERSSMPGKLLGADEARELEPGLRGEIAGAFYEPNEAICEPRRFVFAVVRAAKEAGAKMQLRTDVRRVSDLRADRVVVAAGAWTGRLVPVPVVAGKGYHVDLASAPGDPRMPVFAQEARVIATPFSDRLRLAGTLELCGLESRFGPSRVEAVRRAGERLLGPLPRDRDLEVWAGLRPCTPDGLPVLGPVAGAENVVVASGHATLGLTLAPITGRLVAEFVTGQRPSIDLAPLSPDRFRMRRSRARA